ncbi:TSUP family transporter [Trinickia sp. LjRoot230]|uniref:TSUP family transporter n=1 Tax=Trinickia sp. LjRoot230 TaxID=3342288 RepID=UPI003F4FAB42
MSPVTSLIVLSGASFTTSVFTAAVGIGGGIGLLAVMCSFLPFAAVVPVHGLIQLVSNGSRFYLNRELAETRLLPAYAAGVLLGAGVGCLLLGNVPNANLSKLLGVFILLYTWTSVLRCVGKFIGNFMILGCIQAFLSLFVASVGTISQPVLIKQGLPKDRVIVTHAMQMTVLHSAKVAAFVISGFSFYHYWKVALAMTLTSALGSYVGGSLMKIIPERIGTLLLKLGISAFAALMIAGVSA